MKSSSRRQAAAGRGAQEASSAAALYISSILCGERRTQREVADVAGVTEVTIDKGAPQRGFVERTCAAAHVRIRNRYKELAEKLDIDIIL